MTEQNKAAPADKAQTECKQTVDEMLRQTANVADGGDDAQTDAADAQTAQTADADAQADADAEKSAEAPAKSGAKPDAKSDGAKPDKGAHALKYAAELAAAKEKAQQFEQQLKSAKDTLLRTAAEYDNFRKRSAREHDAAFNNGVAHAAEALLPIIDTLTLAANTPTADENYKKGVQLTLDQCKKSLDKLGVKEIAAQGAPFDPNLHAAVMQRPAENPEQSGTVLQVLQSGYTLGDKVVRHATVVVAQ